jgi:Flp pilus assembly protein TadG
MNRLVTSVGKRIRGLRRLNDTTASEVAEAALVLPLAFMMLLGIYWFGRAFNIYATINHAAREGARTAVAQSCGNCGNAPNGQVAAVVQQALQASSVDPNQAQSYTPAPALTFCTGTAATQCSALTIGASGSFNYCTDVQLNANNNPNLYPAVCGVSVNFQYPYQFWLPFTSLNQQQFLLKADVQMKGEY